MTQEELKSFILRLFFLYAWKKRPKYCECGCGRYLPKEISTACMDHLIEKSPHPECKYSLKNIMYVTQDCHTQKTNGYPNDKQKQKIDEAWENYDDIVKESSIFEERIKSKIGG
jgi:hypothetical protein